MKGMEILGILAQARLQIRRPLSLDKAGGKDGRMGKEDSLVDL